MIEKYKALKNNESYKKWINKNLFREFVLGDVFGFYIHYAVESSIEKTKEDFEEEMSLFHAGELDIRPCEVQYIIIAVFEFIAFIPGTGIVKHSSKINNGLDTDKAINLISKAIEKNDFNLFRSKIQWQDRFNKSTQRDLKYCIYKYVSLVEESENKYRWGITTKLLIVYKSMLKDFIAKLDSILVKIIYRNLMVSDAISAFNFFYAEGDFRKQRQRLDAVTDFPFFFYHAISSNYGALVDAQSYLDDDKPISKYLRDAYKLPRNVLNLFYRSSVQSMLTKGSLFDGRTGKPRLIEIVGEFDKALPKKINRHYVSVMIDAKSEIDKITSDFFFEFRNDNYVNFIDLDDLQNQDVYENYTHIDDEMRKKLNEKIKSWVYPYIIEMSRNQCNSISEKLFTVLSRISIGVDYIRFLNSKLCISPKLVFETIMRLSVTEFTNLVHEWHINLNRIDDFYDEVFCYQDRNGKPIRYKAPFLCESSVEVGNNIIIFPLMTKESLSEEGKTMENCVGNYYSQLIFNNSYIFSVFDSNEHIGTMELYYSKSSKNLYINQIYGPKNTRLSKKTIEIIEKWFTKNEANLKNIAMKNSSICQTNLTLYKKLKERNLNEIRSLSVSYYNLIVKYLPNILPKRLKKL